VIMLRNWTSKMYLGALNQSPYGWIFSSLLNQSMYLEETTQQWMD
jgi:hypothetical protein